jgi:ribosomal protein S18 acetylase RimI-like enzyme
MASDCLLDNTDSYNFHLKIGYEETERNIFFLKTLEPQDYESGQDNIILNEFLDADEKSAICNSILRALPDWFGVEASILDYTEQVKKLPFIAAYDGDNAVGFIALKSHTPYASEICVMGVLKEYHRRGIGRSLVAACEKQCRENKQEFLTVKTLAESRESKSYQKTRLFYLSLGFKPVEVFPALWDEENPCLLMIKRI